MQKKSEYQLDKFLWGEKNPHVVYEYESVAGSQQIKNMTEGSDTENLTVEPPPGQDNVGTARFY